eukprot:gene18922-22966_t
MRVGGDAGGLGREACGRSAPPLRRKSAEAGRSAAEERVAKLQQEEQQLHRAR